MFHKQRYMLLHVTVSYLVSYPELAGMVDGVAFSIKDRTTQVHWLSCGYAVISALLIHCWFVQYLDD